MPLTTPNGIFYIDNNSVASRAVESAMQAQSIEDALTTNYTIRTFRWADQTEMDNQTDMQEGDEGYRTDLRITYKYIGSDWRLVTPGLNLIRPSSVVGGTMDDLGRVSFGGGATVRLNGVFSSAFRSYVIYLDYVASGTITYDVKLSVGGSDDSTADYDAERLLGSETTVVASTVSGATSWTTPFHPGARSRHALKLELFAPAEAAPTSGIGVWMSNNDATNRGAGVTSLRKRGLTAFDGISFLFSGDPDPGKVSVYGLL